MMPLRAASVSIRGCYYSSPFPSDLPLSLLVIQPLLYHLNSLIITALRRRAAGHEARACVTAVVVCHVVSRAYKAQYVHFINACGENASPTGGG